MSKKTSGYLLLILCSVAVAQAADNLLINPGFETGDFTGWSEWNQCLIVTDAYEGTYAASLSDDHGVYQYGITLPAVDDYTLAFWTKGDIATGEYYLGIVDPGGNIVTHTFVITPEWTQIIVPFTLSEATTADLWLWGGNTGTSGNVIVDDFQLVRGEIGPSLKAQNPDPSDGQTAVLLDADLSWTAGDDPNITEVYSFDVYVDPNIAKVQSGDTDCLYVSLARGPTATTYDPNPSGDNFVPDTIYYWRVDTELQLDNMTEPNLISGIIWSFSTSIPSSRPQVNAGENLLSTVAMGLAGIQLNGTVIDPDDNLITVEWSVIEQPGGSTVEFTDASDPATTITVDAVGLYVLKLFAEDADGQVSSDQIEILIYANPCEAAQNNPDGYSSIDSDTDSSCEIDIEDFASIASEWLKDNYLTEYATYEEDIIQTNLLINPGFETGDETGWDAWGVYSLPTIVSGEQLSGSYCGMVVGSGFAQLFYPKPGSTYEFSCNYKGSVTDVNAWWGCYTEDKQSGILFTAALVNFTDEYQKVTERLTVPLDWQYPELEFWVYLKGGKNTGYFDDLQIMEILPVVEIDTSKAHAPEPEDSETNVPVNDLTLSFNAGLSENLEDPNFMIPNPAITAHYLYFSNDANLPGSPIELAVDVDPADGNVDPVAFYTITEPLLRNQMYYWRVDESLNNDANIITGDVWSFTTEMTGPRVDAGLNWIAWLDPNMVTVQLDATVTDPDDNLSSVLWSVYEKPGDCTVIFTPDETVEDPAVTVDATGRYLLKLWAQDEDGFTDGELMAVNVYADACQAALNHPDLVDPLDGDINSDCNVNIDDLLALITDWMKYDYLTETVIYLDYTYIAVNGYVVNGGFETGDTTGWESYGEAITDNPYEGAYACSMTDSLGSRQDMVLHAGDYILTFWVRGDISSGSFNCGVDNADGYIIAEYFEVTDEWVQLSYQFTVTEDQDISIWFWGTNSGGTTGTCVVDDVWVVEQQKLIVVSNSKAAVIISSAFYFPTAHCKQLGLIPRQS